MLPDTDLQNTSIIIVTGSNLQAERYDRPQAYRLQKEIERYQPESFGDKSVVISDLWYLNCELLHHVPMVSVGGPEVNAVSAWLHKRLEHVLLIDHTLSIQMDANLHDLRACVWGCNPKLTGDALDLFIQRGYLKQFLEAAKAHQQ